MSYSDDEEQPVKVNISNYITEEEEEEDHSEAWKKEYIAKNMSTMSAAEKQKYGLATEDTAAAPNPKSPLSGGAVSGSAGSRGSVAAAVIKSSAPMSASGVIKGVHREAPKAMHEATQVDVIDSYLMSHEQNMQTFKPTAISDSSRWGKNAGAIVDESKNPVSSILEKQALAAKERQEEEQRLKEEKIRSLKEEVGALILDPSSNSFPYQELSGKNVPKGVDPTKREQYLADSEFEQLFGMTKEQFNGLGLHKKRTLKMKLSLF